MLCCIVACAACAPQVARHIASHQRLAASIVTMSEVEHEQETLFEPDALSLLFASPLLRINLDSGLPRGTIQEIEEHVLGSWRDHCKDQQRIRSTGRVANSRRASDGGEDFLAKSPQELNEEFFYFQRNTYGDMGHNASPHSNPESWMACDAAQQLLAAVTAAASAYLDRISHHAGHALTTTLDPNQMHMWASIHQDSSSHAAHVHAGAVLSGVFYVRCPLGSGQICFSDPRGSIPPFEREVCHEPRAGELLIFPPWLSHAVSSTPSTVDGPRISISFNYVDAEDSLGFLPRWGEATAALEAVTLEKGLSLSRAD
jgi:hypothetical protein